MKGVFTLAKGMRSVFLNLLKMSVVGLLLIWMISSGKLSLSQMSIFLTTPSVIISGVMVWIISPVLMGSWRWWLLLKGAGLECKFTRALHFQLIGFFFNTAMPGAVGGDIVKAIYIMKEQANPSGKTPALLAVLLDRIVGLIGLFAMGAMAALWSYESISVSPFASQLINGLTVVFLLSFVFLGFVFMPYKAGKDPFAAFLSRPFFGFEKILGIYLALRAYKDKPGILFGTIALSIVMQFIFLLYMGFIGTVMYEDFSPALLAPIYPFGILVTALPLAPGGLGVGHAAFDKLFSLVGLPGGANVFNIFTLSQLALNLCCFIPYLLTKKKIETSHEVQVANS
jgi:uncharacterized protein (TIRG00374 family)